MESKSRFEKRAELELAGLQTKGRYSVGMTQKRVRHEMAWIFQAVTHKIALPFAFDKNVSMEYLNVRELMSHKSFTKELNEMEQSYWPHMMNPVCIRAWEVCNHEVQGEEDDRLSGLASHAYYTLRFAYPANFMNSFQVEADMWRILWDEETGKMISAHRHIEDDGYRHWSIGYNACEEQGFKFFTEPNILTPEVMQKAHVLYGLWHDPVEWRKNSPLLTIATTLLHRALQNPDLLFRYIGCSVALEALFSTYEEFLGTRSNKKLWMETIFPRLERLLQGKILPDLCTKSNMELLYTWRGILAHRGTGSFVSREDTEKAMRPDPKGKDRVMGLMEALTRTAVVNAWLDRKKYASLF